MKEVDPNNFPKYLSDDDYEALVRLVMKNPISALWKQVVVNLTPEQKIEINRRVRNLNDMANNSALNSRRAMSDDEWEDKKRELEAHKFYGNMGQPETPEQFKDRYGVWPPGYGENEEQDKE